MPKRPRPAFRPNPKLAQFVYGGRPWPGYWEEALERVSKAESEDDLLMDDVGWFFTTPRSIRAVVTAFALAVFCIVAFTDSVLRAVSIVPWAPFAVAVSAIVVLGGCVAWLVSEVYPRPRRSNPPPATP
jgi:hypothetical protein